MPDFTVIEGGGNGRRTVEEVLARQSFATFVIELLRALGRDRDDGFRVTAAMISFVEKVRAADLPLGPLLAEEITDLHNAVFGLRREDDHDREVRSVLEAAFRTTIEHMADDEFAKARRSRQETKLRAAIEQALLSREKRARENGGFSYLKSLSDRVGKWPPPKNGRKQPKKVARKRETEPRL